MSMPKAFKTMALALAGMVVVFFAVGLLLSDRWHVETVRTIRAPMAKVAELVQDFGKWESWSSMKLEMGPGTQREISGTPGAVGHRIRWNAPHANAVLEVVAAGPQFLQYDFLLQVPPAPQLTPSGHGTVRWEADGEGCRVTWSDDGTWDNLALRWFGWFGALQEQVKQVQGTSLAGLQRAIDDAAAGAPSPDAKK
jgi:hypothetical protein